MKTSGVRKERSKKGKEKDTANQCTAKGIN